jgi:3-oxoacyl-[acyl-carrier protein] reductase
MNGRLDGKVALVTGSSRGIGKAIATLFAREGASVVVNFVRSSAEAAKVAAEINSSGSRAIAVRADVSRRSEVSALVGETVSTFGKVDVLVNNAGVFAGGGASTLTDEDLDKAFSINVKGAIACAQTVAPHMKANGGGRIINISSIAALSTTTPDQIPYAIAKAALNAATKRFAVDLGRFNITVNAICPGPVRTDMAVAGDSPEETEARFLLLAKKAVLGRVGSPEDIAACALFLASNDARMITGQVLTVDGGRTDYLSRSD